MINNDRIVPIVKVDFLSMIGTVLNLIGTSYTVLDTTSIEGDFSVTEDAGTYLANQPVKTLDFADGVSASTVYFVAGFDYAGFTVNGAAATLAAGSAEVAPDGITLYKAVLATGEITISVLTPSAATV